MRGRKNIIGSRLGLKWVNVTQGVTFYMDTGNNGTEDFLKIGQCMDKTGTGWCWLALESVLIRLGRVKKSRIIVCKNGLKGASNETKK